MKAGDFCYKIELGTVRCTHWRQCSTHIIFCCKKLFGKKSIMANFIKKRPDMPKMSISFVRFSIVVISVFTICYLFCLVFGIDFNLVLMKLQSMLLVRSFRVQLIDWEIPFLNTLIHLHPELQYMLLSLLLAFSISLWKYP